MFTLRLDDAIPFYYPVFTDQSDIIHQFGNKNNLVKFYLGTLHLDSSVKWNYEDCMYVYKKGINFIECEGITFHLNKLCVALDFENGYATQVYFIFEKYHYIN